MRIVARLRSDTGVTQALARVTALDPAGSGKGTPPVYTLTPINTAAIPVRARAGMAQFARLLGTTVAFLLLIGCGTVGMLLLIRTEARREELAFVRRLGRVTRAPGARHRPRRSDPSGAGAIAAVPIASWLFKGIGTFQLPGGIDIGLPSLAWTGARSPPPRPRRSRVRGDRLDCRDVRTHSGRGRELAIARRRHAADDGGAARAPRW